MGFSVTDWLVDGALDAAGFGSRPTFKLTDPSRPREVNALPVIYGRPGWVQVLPVIVDTKQRRNRGFVTIVYAVGEGVMRVSEAYRVNEYLDHYAARYIRTTQADQEATLGLLSDKCSGSWASGLGYKVFSVAAHFSGFPLGSNQILRDENGDLTRTDYAMSGVCAISATLSYLGYDPESVTEQYVPAGEVPSFDVLPNGIVLHDPRITPGGPDDYLSADMGWMKDPDPSQIPRWSLGGARRGYNHQSTSYLMSPVISSQGWQSSKTRRDVLGDTPDNNPALVILDYLTAPIYGAEIPLDDINMPSLIAGADYCDAPAPTWVGGPSQPQFACDIKLDTEDKLRDNLQKILATCRAGLGWIDGQYHLQIRRAGQPVVFHISERHIIKRSSISYGKKTDRLNRIIATFTDSAMRYKERQVVYPPPASAEFTQWMDEDGQLLEKEITLHGVNNLYRAVDMANTLVRESRASIKASYACTLELLQVTAGDLVRVTDDKFSAKLFWVESVSFSFKTRQVLLNLREQDEQAYDTLLHPEDIQDEGGLVQPGSPEMATPQGLQFASASASNLVTSGTISWAEINWPAQHQYSVAIFRSGDSAPLHTGTTRELNYSVPYLAPGNYIAQVRLLASNLESAPAQLAFTLDVSAMPLPAVTGLRLAGGGTSYSEAAAFEIDRADEEPAWLAGYEWRIYAGATLLRTRVTSNPAYTYRLSENLADGGHRTIRANVRRKSISGEYGPDAELEVTQPAPAAPSGISITTGITSVSVAWQSPHKCRAYMSTTPGFSPALANQVYVGTGGTVTVHELQPATTHYLRIVPEDEFGTGNSSGELQALTASNPVPGIQDQLDRLDGPAEMPGSVLQLVDTERQQRETNESFNAALQAVLSRAHDAQRAAVQSFEVVRATTTEALTQQITLAVSRINNNESAIYNESLTRATETGSLASQVALLQAKVDARPVFASGWEPGLDYDRWTASTGTLTPETTDVFTGLQSGLLNGTISAPVSSGTADGFSGRDVRLVIQVKAAPGTALDVSYAVGSYSSGWQPVTVTAEWAEQAVTLTVPGETAGNAGTLSIRTTAGSVLIDRLILENADSDLPVITAEIERISNAQADLEGAVASELVALESQFNDSLALVQQSADSKVSETEAIAIVESTIQAKGYDGTLAGITSEQTALANEQTAQSTRLDALAAGTGLGETGISERGVSLATDIQLSSIVENVISAASKTGAAAFTSLKEVVVTKDAARTVSQEQQAVQLNDLAADYTEYKRSAIGYCVDANGNPTSHADAVSCELVLGNRWITAPLAEALTRARITLPGGETASAGLLLQSLSDGVDELTARAALAIDVNGRVSGLFLEGSETASALDIEVDSFRIKTAGGSKTPFEVVGDEVRLVDAVVSGTIDIQGVASFGGVKIGGPMPIIQLTDEDDVQVGLIGYESRVAIPGQKNPTRMIELGNSSWTTGLVYLECNNAAGDQFAAIEMVTGNGRAINTDGSIVGSSLSAVAGGLSTLVAPAKVTTPQMETTSGTALITTPARTPQIRLGMSISGIPISRDRFPISPQEGDVYRSRSFSTYSAKLCVYLDGAWRVVQTTGAYAPGNDIP